MEVAQKAAKEASRKVFSLASEFRNFAFKGNVVDMAVAVIIGGAFGKVVDSLVKNILMPSINLLLPGKQEYVDWKFTVGEKTVPYGLFLGEFLNFLLVALAVFVFIVKFLGWLMRSKKKAEEKAPPPPTKDQELLAEIRDLLKKSGTKA